MTTKYFTAKPEPNLNAPAPYSPDNDGQLTLAYQTFGSPDQPAVLMPTCFGGLLHETLTFLRTPDQHGNPPVLAGYFVIVVGLLGGSESSSPSNFVSPATTTTTTTEQRFPSVTYEDNIHLQYALCQALLGGTTHHNHRKLAAYIGFSMGGQQAYHMAVLYPHFVERAVILASSARTSWHNWSFLEGPKAALVNAVDFCDEGAYDHHHHQQQPAPAARRGTRAFHRAYATWALSPPWFRARSWETLGYASLAAYLEAAWSGEGRHAHDLLCMVDTWQRGDISLLNEGGGPSHPLGSSSSCSWEKGDLAAALASIQARVLVMPSRTDCYFPPEDSEEEVKHLKQGELSVIESIWGHVAGGGGGTPEDNEFICKEVARWLAT